jgi:Cu2+-containing amine oxidase
MKTITKFIFGLPLLTLASGSIAFAQVQFAPGTPADSAAKAAAQAAAEGAAEGAAPLGAPVTETVVFESGSRWHLTLDAINKFGLVIRGASFKKTLTSPFILVLFDGRLGEIFVPYHPGNPRFFDISEQGPYPPATLNRADFPAPRQIIGGGKICKEVRKYLAWMNFQFPNDLVRYGEEVVYFSVLKAANYAYVEEWTFRDDGTILVRAGSTGPKFGGPDDTTGHMHTFTWRLDIDLNGANGNSAYWTSHSENPTVPNSRATDRMFPILVEGSRVWNPRNFRTLEIFDRTLTNGNPDRPRPTSYELVPMRTGTARHSEPYTMTDFWVTRYKPEEILAVNLPTYIRDGQPTVNEDLVIWYTGSAHHEDNPRDEDRNTVPMIWTGFELVPHNLFDHTPFYPNS